LSGPQWVNITDDAKSFVRALMTLNPSDRLDVRQALQHRWMTRPDASQPPPPQAMAGSATSITAPFTAPAPAPAKQRSAGRTSLGPVAQRKKSSASDKMKRDAAPPTAPPTAPIEEKRAPMDPPPAAPVERKKTFCPVFWSARRQISATLSGAIPCGQIKSAATATATATPSSSATAVVAEIKCNISKAVSAGDHTGRPAHREVSRPGPGPPSGSSSSSSSSEAAVMSWYEPVPCWEGEEDIDEFSSSGEEEASSRPRDAMHVTKGGTSCSYTCHVVIYYDVFLGQQGKE
jgi:serine/threonine protein kinase